MKAFILHLVERTSFQTQTTILVWIIIIGFGLISGVALLSLAGLKNEFDDNSPYQHNLHMLLALNKAEIEDYETRLPEMLEVWEQYKMRSIGKVQNEPVRKLREWYAQTFQKKDYEHIQNLIARENIIIESIDLAFINKYHNRISGLIEEQVLISFDISFYDKKITDCLYHHAYMLLIIFLIIVGSTMVILTLLVRKSINTNHLLLEDLVKSKTHELRNLNINLQKSIAHEVEQSRKKDLIMYQQARLASMGEMIQNIAHQWRQPLNALALLIQSFKLKADQGKLTQAFVDKQTQYGLKIATQMSDTIENFRNFFRPETSKEYFELESSTWASIELLRARLQEHSIHIEVCASNETKNISILGYQNSFTQVMLIIINNAIDAIILASQNNTHTQQGRIKISLDKIGYNIKLCVKDNAGGITLEDISKVFEPYFTTKHKFTGTGVGLYMAKQIVERSLHGTIYASNAQWGEAKQYYGAVFTLHFKTQKDVHES